MSTIRPMHAPDLARVNAIVNHYIKTSHVTFHVEPWSEARRREWFDIRSADPRYPLIVAEAGEEVLGAAWSGPYRSQPAYRRSVETTVMVDPEHTGRGVGRQLLRALIAALAPTGAHRAYAVIALPNPASIALHRGIGYHRIGVLSESGYKFGRYWSIELLEFRFIAP